MEIKTFCIHQKFCKINEEIPDVKINEETPGEKIHVETPDEKIHEEVSESSNVPEKIKFKCDLCSSNFRKEITLKKHKNIRHDPNYCPSDKKIGEGNFGFAVRPGKETAAEALRLELSKEKKD